MIKLKQNLKPSSVQVCDKTKAKTKPDSKTVLGALS